MAIQFVRSDQVLTVNGENYQWPANPEGISKSISCINTEIVGAFWKVPVTQGLRVIGYNYLVATDDVKPQDDAVKVLRVKVLDNGAGMTYEMAVTDDDCITTNSFIDKCNGCCGDTPVMTDVDIPTPILQLPPQSTDSDGNRTFVFAFPTNPLSRLYAIPYPWFNGAAPAQAYEPTGIDSAADFVVWANTSGKWDDYGTWANPSGDIVTLVSAPADTIYVSEAGMQISLTPVSFCFDLTAFSTPAAVNGIKFGSGATLPFSAFMLTNANQTTLIDRIKKFMPGATFTVISNKLQISTVQDTPKLYNDTSVVATAASGAC